MEKIEAVVFDLGRVLTRIVLGDKFVSLMRKLGIPPEEAFGTYWKTPEVVDLMIGKIDGRRFHALVEERFATGYSFEAFADAWCDLFQPMPGMETLFGELADRYPLGLLSDTDPLHWARVQTLYPWLKRVAVPTLSFAIGCLKPDPALYAHAVAHSGKPGGRCLFIDDIPGNVDGAKQFGMQGLQFQGEEQLRRDLARLGVL